jgi:hypothetical protein
MARELARPIVCPKQARNTSCSNSSYTFVNAVPERGKAEYRRPVKKKRGGGQKGPFLNH